VVQSLTCTHNSFVDTAYAGGVWVGYIVRTNWVLKILSLTRKQKGQHKHCQYIRHLATQMDYWVLLMMRMPPTVFAVENWKKSHIHIVNEQWTMTQHTLYKKKNMIQSTETLTCHEWMNIPTEDGQNGQHGDIRNIIILLTFWRQKWSIND
jgi:hypothetical protein